MSVFDKFVTFLGLLVSRPRVLVYYFIFKRRERMSLPSLIDRQNRSLVNFLKWRSPLLDVDACSVRDHISELGVVSKEMMKESPEKYNCIGSSSKKYKQVQTGGSTGSPLKYFLDYRCEDIGMALLFRGWSYGGYKLGDRVAILAGGSLVGKTVGVKSRLIQRILNQKKYTSFGVGEDDFYSYYESMKKWRARYLRGYVSSVYEFAKYLNKKGLTLKFNAVFTTAEMLGKSERDYIESTFSCKVYNNYGLNDGGVSAYECALGSLHIDLERSLLEVVDDNNRPITGSVGKIIATAFNNKATCFIRYDTGDLGAIGDEPCACGLPYPVLKELKGRSTDALCINGKMIGSPVLTVLMSHTSVKRYQFHCYNDHVLLIVDADKDDFEKNDMNLINDSFRSHVGDFEIRVSFDCSSFDKTTSGKHKVVVNHV